MRRAFSASVLTPANGPESGSSGVPVRVRVAEGVASGVGALAVDGLGCASESGRDDEPAWHATSSSETVAAVSSLATAGTDTPR